MEEPKKNGSQYILGSLASVATLVALIGGIASVVRPIEYRMDEVQGRMERIEMRALKAIEELDRKLQMEIASQAKFVESHQAALRMITSAMEERATANFSRITALEVRAAVLEAEKEEKKP